jgi:hypothetical protein
MRSRRRSSPRVPSHLEQELGAAAVEFHVAELIDQEQVHAAVTVDGAGELFLVACFDEFVDELRRELVDEAVLDPRRCLVLLPRGSEILPQHRIDVSAPDRASVPPALAASTQPSGESASGATQLQ